MRVGYTVTTENRTDANNVLGLADVSTRTELENELEKNIQSMPDLGSVTVVNIVGEPQISCPECPGKITSHCVPRIPR